MAGRAGIMHIITRKRLNDFAAAQPETRSALARCYAIMRKAHLVNFDYRNKIYLRHVLTHEEYDRGKWKNKHVCARN